MEEFQKYLTGEASQEDRSEFYQEILRDQDLRRKYVDAINMWNLSNIVSKNDMTAIKIHFGERGNEGYIKPEFVKSVVNRIKKLKAKTFPRPKKKPAKFFLRAFSEVFRKHINETYRKSSL